MLLQTNSYLVPRDKRVEHAKLLRRFRQCLLRLGCESFEIYEQVGTNWNASQSTGRFVQIMRFRDRRHQQAVQQVERADPTAQKLIAEFCQLINFPYQQQQGLFATSYYTSLFALENARAGAAAANVVEDETSTVATEPIAAPPPVEPARSAVPRPVVDRSVRSPAAPEPTPPLPPPGSGWSLSGLDEDNAIELEAIDLDKDDPTLPTPTNDLETAPHPVDAEFAEAKIPPRPAEPPRAARPIEKQPPVIPTIEYNSDRTRKPAEQPSRPGVAPLRNLVESLEERSLSTEEDDAAALNEADDGLDELLNELEEKPRPERRPQR